MKKAQAVLQFVGLLVLILLCGCGQSIERRGVVDFGYQGEFVKRAGYVLVWNGVKQVRIGVEATAPAPPRDGEKEFPHTRFTSWTLAWRVDGDGDQVKVVSGPEQVKQPPELDRWPDEWSTVYGWKISVGGDKGHVFTLILIRKGDGRLLVHGLVGRELDLSSVRIGASLGGASDVELPRMELHLDTPGNEAHEQNADLDVLLGKARRGSWLPPLSGLVGYVRGLPGAYAAWLLAFAARGW